MAAKLNLKARPTRDTLTLPYLLIKGVVDRQDKEGLWKLFSSLADEDGTTVHDKHWLELIINWMPEGGLPLSESAKWFKLAERVGMLDRERDGVFTLSDYQVDLIWKRLTDPKFKMDRLPTPFVMFVRDLQKATGKHFHEEEPDAEDQSE
jgi:hypothetical protein